MAKKLLTLAAVSALTFAACASDETPDEPDGTVPVDDSVDDGIDTEVEQSENLGFDEPDEG